MSYKAPARLDDLVEVRSRLLAIKGATLSAEQVVSRGGQELASLALRIACITRDGRPARIPEALRRALQPYLSPA